MTVAVTIDVAGGSAGGAARFRAEVQSYVTRCGRADVRIIGTRRRLGPAWLVGREAIATRRSRRVALNNVGFFAPGGERWTLLANALHFLAEAEAAALDPALRAMAARQAVVVHRAARRSDVLIAPCTAMAERIANTLPDVSDRLVVRMHPVSAGPASGEPIRLEPVSTGPVSTGPDDQMILCPIVFESYKHMPQRLAEWLAAVDHKLDPSVRMLVTAHPSEVPARLAGSPRFDFAGRLGHTELGRHWACSRAVYFPPGLEAFGFPLAEARASGLPVIARDTPQNQEIAGAALCGFVVGDQDSLRQATEIALTRTVTADPAPFDPDVYFGWMLGSHA